MALTVSYRRAEVAGFWILGTLVVWLSIGFTGAAVGAQASWTWATATALAAVLPGLVWHPWFETVVWAWNGSVRRLAGGLRMCVLAAAYYMLFAAVSCASSRGQSLRLPNSSAWLVRGPSSPGADDIQSPPAGRGSDQGLGAFAQTAENGWAATLVPIVFLLKLLSDEQQQNDLPGSTYTLY